jgi:septum site-determining protein MinC
MNKRFIEFKGTKDGVYINCLEGVPFEDILGELGERLLQRAAFFGTAQVRVDVGSRDLNDGETEQLAAVIRENSKMQLAGIQACPDQPPADYQGASHRGLDEGRLEGFKEGRALVIKRTLRSGQGIHFPGNVLVLGDVNPGAEIIAEGDIFVFGTIRGIAHAGAGGDRSASVVALRLAPTQLRIADVISRSPDEALLLPDQAEYAYISEGRILIAAIATKTGS